jgi:hypothetical protein
MGEVLIWFVAMMFAFYLGATMGWKAGIDAAEATGVSHGLSSDVTH